MRCAAGHVALLLVCSKLLASGRTRDPCPRPAATLTPLFQAHSSSGLGHRPLTAAARVRIPYAPLYSSLSAEFRSTMRTRVSEATGLDRAVPARAPGIEPTR